MPLTITQPRKVGRPQASPRTIRILPSGVIRLSPDLCTSKRFDVTLNLARMHLTIKPGKRYALRYSSPHARSGLLHIGWVFESGEITREKLKHYAGEYPVTKIGKEFMVAMSVQR